MIEQNMCQDWQDGYKIGFEGKAFALNPYPTADKSLSYDNTQKNRNQWSAGYWAGVKDAKTETH